MKALLIIASRNVFKHWRHSLSALISIAASYFSLVIFEEYIIDVEALYLKGFRNRSMYGDVIVQNPTLQSVTGKSDPFSYSIPLEIHHKITEHISTLENVESFTRIQYATGLVTNGGASTVFIAEGFDVENGYRTKGPDWQWDALYGKPLKLANAPENVMLGQALAKNLGCTPEIRSENLFQNGNFPPVDRPFHCTRQRLQMSLVTPKGQSNAIDVQPVGIVDAGYADIDTRWINIPIEGIWQLLNEQSVRFISILLKDPEQSENFISKFNSFLDAQGITTIRAIPWLKLEIAQFYLQTIGLLNIFKFFIVLVTLIVSMLSVLNTMAKNIKERSREIGTLRSIGYRSNQIQFIFVVESTLLTLFGIAIGLILSTIALVVLNSSHLSYRGGILALPVLFHLKFSLATHLKAISLLLVVATITSWLTSRRTSRSTVSDNLTAT